MKYFVVGYKGTPLGTAGSAEGCVFDLQAGCSRCGTGAPLVGDLHVRSRGKSFGFAASMTYQGDLVISDEIRQRIISDIAKSADFRRVWVNGKLSNYFCLYPRIILPPFNKPISKGYDIEDQCPECLRDGYFSKLLGFESQCAWTYSEWSTEKSTIYFTYECFGTSNKIAKANRILHVARPKIVLGEQIMALLKSSARGFFSSPICRNG